MTLTTLGGVSLNRLILRHFQPEAATCVDAARQVSHNCGPKLSRREVGI